VQGLAQRVPSFDRVPLDVDVTLPATGSGPFPVIAIAIEPYYRAGNLPFTVQLSDLSVSLPTT